MQKLELLAPAKDYDSALAAINCGADAIYIGANKFGARQSAGNSVEDIKKIIEESGNVFKLLEKYKTKPIRTNEWNNTIR